MKLSDIAQETGYSIYTVSCALRNKGNLSTETRIKVKEAAERMGYQGNAAASMLAKQRLSSEAEGKQMTIGWTGGSGDPSNYAAGLTQGCKELGYTGILLHPDQYPSAKNMIKVLWNRGIKGLIIDNWGNHWTETEWANADWDLLSVVKITRINPLLAFHLVRHSAFDYMLFTLNQVYEHGYRRIMVLLVESLSDLDDTARLGAVLAFQKQMATKGCVVELLQFDHADKAYTLDQATIQSIKSFGADAVVGFPYRWIYGLRKAEFDIPHTLGFATPLSSSQLHGVTAATGCEIQSIEMGRRAIIRLNTLIQTGEKGMTPHFLQDVVDPIWVDCGTLLDRNRSVNSNLHAES